MSPESDAARSALHRVNGIPQKYRTDFAAIARLSVMCHTGSDAYGNRITSDERQRCRRFLEQVRINAAQKHTDGDMIQFFNLMNRYGLDDEGVELELIRRFTPPKPQ